MIYYYAWKNNPKREELYGRRFRVIARGSMNSVLVEFEDGQKEIISRNAIRRVKSNSCRIRRVENGTKRDDRRKGS